MASKKPPDAFDRLTVAHERLRQKLYKRLPGPGDKTIQITVSEAMALLSECSYMKGQICGLLEGVELLKVERATRK